MHGPTTSDVSKQQLTVLQVAYALAPVAPDTAGGAEQILATIDAALVARGHRSIVVAARGSHCRGELVTTPLPERPLDERRAAAQLGHRCAIERVLERERVDVVHLHGLDFAAYLPPPGPPVLVTLHLPLSWYPPAALCPRRPRTFLHAVSDSQRRECPGRGELIGVIENGVDLDQLHPELGTAQHAPEPAGHALVMGRICPEKSFHEALDAATAAGLELVLAGDVFPYPEHERYFEEAIRPRLDERRRYVGRVGGERKGRLLSRARCVLIPSRVAETSSLVAMEALASGTPVVAYRAGAPADLIEPGVTGYLVDDVEQMAAAALACGDLDRARCRKAAERRFSAAAMIEQYLEVYRFLAAGLDDPVALARLVARAGSERCGAPTDQRGEEPCTTP